MYGNNRKKKEKKKKEKIQNQAIKPPNPTNELAHDKGYTIIKFLHYKHSIPC